MAYLDLPNQGELRFRCPAQRQTDRERAALARFALHRQRSAVALNDALSTRQPDARAADPTDYVATSPEGLEYVRHILSRNAEALVAHHDGRPPVALRERD